MIAGLIELRGIVIGEGVSNIRNGLDLDDIFNTTDEERTNYLNAAWRFRGPLYRLEIVSLLVDYAPQSNKFHWKCIEALYPDAPESTTGMLLSSCQNLHSYMLQGWDTGIRNEFFELQRLGLSVEEIMEIVTFSQLYTGMRGLGLVYRAVGDFLPVYALPKAVAQFPAGWASDSGAFRSGMDFGHSEMSDSDRLKLTAWYEQTIGYLPKSIEFGLKHHPSFVKASRGKWEVAIRTLPKQVVPHIMLRHQMLCQSSDGLREAVCLSKAWGITKDCVVQSLAVNAAYFTGLDGFYLAADAVDDVLRSSGWATD